MRACSYMLSMRAVCSLMYACASVCTCAHLHGHVTLTHEHTHTHTRKHTHAHTHTGADDVRTCLQVLQKIPFSLPFSLRVRVLRNLIHQDRALVHDAPHEWIRARVHRDRVLQGNLLCELSHVDVACKSKLVSRD